VLLLLPLLLLLLLLSSLSSCIDKLLQQRCSCRCHVCDVKYVASSAAQRLELHILALQAAAENIPASKTIVFTSAHVPMFPT
jgi:hypothetical protein